MVFLIHRKNLMLRKIKRPGAQLGDIKYIDVNDDKKIDDLDKVRLYDSSIPKLIFGLNFDFEYKGFELSMFWQGTDRCKNLCKPNRTKWGYQHTHVACITTVGPRLPVKLQLCQGHFTTDRTATIP